MKAQYVYIGFRCIEQDSAGKSIRCYGAHRFEQDGMMSDEELARVVRGESNCLGGGVQAECNGTNSSPWVTDLDTAIVPFFSHVEWKESIRNFNYSSQAWRGRQFLSSSLGKEGPCV
jgi:hypothetical protein